MRLKDKVAIITGGGRGLGRAFALRFAEEGSKVVVCARTLSQLEEVVKEIENKGGEALAIRTDVSVEADTLEMARKTAERFGRIDILVNNAASYSELGIRPWESWSVEEWEQIFTTNVTGGWLCVKAVFPYMKAIGKGKIINISDAAFDQGFPGLLPYSCSKGAVQALTRSLALGLAPYGIMVNCISPGYTLTEASLEMPGRALRGEDAIIWSRCNRRAEFEEDVVGTAVFLACDDSDFITGQVIGVDGGQIRRW